jgi:hypothetical protein
MSISQLAPNTSAFYKKYVLGNNRSKLKEELVLALQTTDDYVEDVISRIFEYFTKYYNGSAKIIKNSTSSLYPSATSSLVSTSTTQEKPNSISVNLKNDNKNKTLSPTKSSSSSSSSPFSTDKYTTSIPPPLGDSVYSLFTHNSSSSPTSYLPPSSSSSLSSPTNIHTTTSSIPPSRSNSTFSFLPPSSSSSSSSSPPSSYFYSDNFPSNSGNIPFPLVRLIKSEIEAVFF